MYVLIILYIYKYIVLSWPFPATSLKTMINQKCEKHVEKCVLKMHLGKNVKKKCFENALGKKCEKKMRKKTFENPVGKVEL